MTPSTPHQPQHALGYWHQTLLCDPVNDALRAQLPAQVRALRRAFGLAHPREQLPDDGSVLAQQAQAWYASAPGQAVLSTLVAHAWHQLSSIAARAMPAHDARHALFKVPAAALEQLDAEGVEGWQRVGLLGALLHDYGRWAEERIFSYPGQSTLHADLSFVLAQELLAPYALPPLVRQSILHAVLGHTKGATPDDPMPLKLTVNADREQLYGAELVIRLSHHAVGADGANGSFYTDTTQASILSRLSYFCRNRLPGPLFARASHVALLRRELYQFLLRCEPLAQSQQRWLTPLLSEPDATAAGWGGAHQHTQDWAQAQQPGPGPASANVTQALLRLLCAPHLAPGPQYLKSALHKAQAVPPDLAPYLQRALDGAYHARCSEDRRQHRALQRILQAYPEDALIQALGLRLTDNWFGPVWHAGIPA